jgi:hypothetical protein
MDNNPILAIISDKSEKNGRFVRVNEYMQMLAMKEHARQVIAEMVFHRFRGRYIKPFLFNDDRFEDHYNNGFSIMASCCLLIETLESFYRGLENTQGRSKEMFESFFRREFKREPAFKGFQAATFYPHVRCGILHQGETTGGFTISKTGDVISDKRRINARKFLSLMEKSLVAYREQLSNEEWDSEIWDNFRRKMRFIIENCRRMV